MDSMLNADAALRPSHADLLMHPWLANQTLSEEQACENMHARKDARDGKVTPMPTLQGRRGARQAVRSGPKAGGKTYCIGPLTEAQREAGDIVALKLNTHDRTQNIPGSDLMYANIAAPDLFDWLTNVI